jgi:hypothetical protein
MMRITPAWESLLAAPTPGQHIAQLYTEPAFLIRAVSQFTRDGLLRDEGVVVIARPVHWRAIARCLETEEVAVGDFQQRGQLAVLDAEECLAGFVVNGMPDRDRFHALIGPVIEAATVAGHGRARAFGEMVDLLRRTSLDATIRLEELWGELLAGHGIALLCGYSVDTFDPQIYRGLLQRVSAAHSDLVPVEDYARLDRAVKRAYAELFGTAGDPEALRRASLARYARPAAMPDAEAAILAFQELIPTRTKSLLDRVRYHYHTAPA